MISFFQYPDYINCHVSLVTRLFGNSISSYLYEKVLQNNVINNVGWEVDISTSPPL